jgi:N-acetylmuramic acid 6-phosphate etherase
MLTLGAMVRLGKTYGHLMVDVRPTSRKLRARALRIVQTVSRRPAPQAARALRLSRGRVKAAILMAKAGLSYPAAVRRLLATDGSLRRALESLTPPSHR